MWRTIKGKTTRETAYLTVSLPAEQAQPADLGTWARSEWHIENRRYVRDITLREDARQARTGNDLRWRDYRTRPSSPTC
jgi:hypothetical protein